MPLRKNQAGFSAIELIVVLVVVVGVGLAGWYVWSSRNKKADTANTTAKTTTASQADSKTKQVPYIVPAGYISFKDASLGFSLSYPSVFGEFGDQKTEYGTNYRATSASTAYGEGISSNFNLYIYDSAGYAINSRKYGPRISLQNGKWIVTEANDADVSHNKVGGEYKDFDGKTLSAQSNEGLSVYTLIGGDEGVERDSLAFVAKNKMYVLQLPQFDSGIYGGNKANDKTAFNTLLSNVRDSIRLTN
jgi:type II secretory pathway pseudopilin PulG